MKNLITGVFFKDFINKITLQEKEQRIRLKNPFNLLLDFNMLINFVCKKTNYIKYLSGLSVMTSNFLLQYSGALSNHIINKCMYTVYIYRDTFNLKLLLMTYSIVCI